MIDKRTVTGKVDAICALMEKHGLQQAVQEKADAIRRDVKQYAFRVLVIGSFNAGKSTFLNRLLGRDGLLPESQAPETAIATELVYDGQEEYVEAVRLDGTRERFSFSDIRSLDAQKYLHIVCHLKNQFLLQNPELILVDMPGLDSNYEWHNKAIAQYIATGSAYILLTPCYAGTLVSSVATFLSEAALYPQGLRCFISQCDQSLPENCELVAKNVREQIEQLYGQPVPVQTISSRDDSDEEFHRKVSDAIASLNLQELFEQRFSGALLELAAMARAALAEARAAVELDTTALQQRIRQCEIDCKKQQDIFERERRDLCRKYDSQVVPSILGDIRGALEQNVDSLLSALESGSGAFNAAVNNIVRPVLYRSSCENIEASFAGIAEQFALPDIEAEIDNAKFSFEEGFKALSEQTHRLQANNEQRLQNGGEGRALYQGITAAVAITTSFINPLLELIVVFLPTILGFLGDSMRRGKQQELQNKLRSSIIPQIISQLEPQVREAVGRVRDSMLESLSEKAQDVIRAKQGALENAVSERDKACEDADARRASFDQSLQALDACLQ